MMDSSPSVSMITGYALVGYVERNHPSATVIT